MDMIADGEGVNVHVYPTALLNESRILKITKTIASRNLFKRIIIVGKWEVGLETTETVADNIEIRRVVPEFCKIPLLSKQVFKIFCWYIRTLVLMVKLNPRCINAHSLPVLPLCVFGKWLTSAKLVYDTHELETEVIRSKGLFRLVYNAVEYMFIRFCDVISVVNEEIADHYRSKCPKKHVFVVQNAPYRFTSSDTVREPVFRNTFKIPENSRIFLYQGLISKGRGIEIIASTFEDEPRYHVVFMGYGPLVDFVKERAAIFENIHYHEAVLPTDIVRYTRSADVGLALIENACMSYYYSLPNKLFEYLSCNIPVIASNFPTMRRLVEEVNGGWLVEPTKAGLVSALSKTQNKVINQDIISRKYCWEAQEHTLVDEYEALFPEK
ncbi:MAG: glycosyltransferase [Roseibium sp.]